MSQIVFLGALYILREYVKTFIFASPIEKYVAYRFVYNGEITYNTAYVIYIYTLQIHMCY